MTRTLIVLGGSSDQLYLVRTAKEMGLFVVVCDQNPASPGFELADASGQVSTRDLAALTAFVRAERDDWPPLGGVITMGSDIPLEVATLAARFDLPHLAPEAARLATDKLAMKERFRERGIPIPWFSEVESHRHLAQIAAERGFPLVLKPIDRSGSRGVFLLERERELELYYRRSHEFSYSGRVMVEEYLPGLQISTESILWHGRDATPGFADRNYEHLERFKPQIMENGGWVPSLLDTPARLAVEQVAVSAARALGIEDGVAKGDLVLTPDGPKVIEIAARLSGGDFCAALVPLSTGLNYVREAIRIALGQPPDLRSLHAPIRQAVANRYFFPPPGRLLRIEGEAPLRREPWLHKLELWYRPGDTIPPTTSHASRFGVFVVTAPDRPTAQARVDEVYERLRIVVG